jgi:nicotinate dehydrogenase subunit A
LHNASPSEQEIREALRFNLCRCGTHVEIVRAALRAAQLVQAEQAMGVAHE